MDRINVRSIFMPVKIMILLIILFCFSVEAQTVQYNQEIQVNSTSWATMATISGLSDAGFVVCWRYNDDIFGQIYDSNRVKFGNEFQVNTSTNTSLLGPSICALSDGGYVVCWRSLYQDVNGFNIYAQVYDLTGTKVGGEFVVSSYTSYGKPCVTGLSDGGFVVCWLYDGDIFGQIYNSNAEKYGEEMLINTYTDGNQNDPSVCGLSDGGFVVCWTGYNQNGSESDIFAQIYESNGNKRGYVFLVNTYTTSSQYSPEVCKLSDNDFIVCWESAGQDGSMPGVYAQLFSNSGTHRGDEFQVNTYTDSYQEHPDVCALADGGFVICWNSWRQDGSYTGVFGQVYDSNDKKIGREFQVNDYTYGDQHFPRVSGTYNGDFMVCWRSRNDNSQYDIYGKYLRKPIVHQLQHFALISPEYDETLNSNTAVFLWNQASSVQVVFPLEMEYTIYLDTDEDFIGAELVSDIYDTTYSVEELTPGQTYFWKVLAKNIAGDSLWSSETFGFYVSPAAGIEDDDVLGTETFKLYANYPNPFNPSTVISYHIPIISDVELSIYNLLGQKVKMLVTEKQSAGHHTFEWDAREFASGVYYYRIEAGEFQDVKKMILLR